MKKFSFVIIAIFIAAAFVIFGQQGHAFGGNTFFFKNKIILGIISLIIAGVFGFIYIKIPKQK